MWHTRASLAGAAPRGRRSAPDRPEAIFCNCRQLVHSSRHEQAELHYTQLLAAARGAVQLVHALRCGTKYRRLHRTTPIAEQGANARGGAPAAGVVGRGTAQRQQTGIATPSDSQKRRDTTPSGAGASTRTQLCAKLWARVCVRASGKVQGVQRGVARGLAKCQVAATVGAGGRGVMASARACEMCA